MKTPAQTLVCNEERKHFQRSVCDQVKLPHRDGGHSPVFQQQSPQDVGSVFSFDLVRDDHLLHHLVGDPRQGLLVQVQQHRT